MYIKWIKQKGKKLRADLDHLFDRSYIIVISESFTGKSYKVESWKNYKSCGYESHKTLEQAKEAAENIVEIWLQSK